ncbi:ABC transporter permease [Streptomyces sp. SID10815]|uniref:ABC transporter permease n=1 Tax=Streptomyces sp. SID10815 TaxID=2706027 RepID=UPI0013C5F7B9|nr:ABC transporter permease [Streptomyces sp. SID10815]NEA52236.1 ABC transporter permease [Streptomyces sp. SID10815]
MNDTCTSAATAATAVPAAARARGARTTATGRMAALARAELTLFVRTRSTLVSAVFVPLALPFSVQSVTDRMKTADAALTTGLIVLPAAVGFSLLFAVYSTLVGVFVTRREQLVLKRLRTGEARDAEILAGAAVPAVVTGLVQSLLLAAACTALLDLPAPHAPQLAVAGLLLGLVLAVALAAVTSAVTRTAESAQVTAIPLVLASMMGSGVMVPLELLPDGMARFCALLPFTPVITLVRGGWTGQLSGAEALRALALALAWTAAAGFAVRRWSRWDPRR